MPAICWLSRRAVMLGLLAFLCLVGLMFVASDGADAAIDDEDDSEFVEEGANDRSWVFADGEVTGDGEGGWSLPSHRSASDWFGYARGFVTSAGATSGGASSPTASVSSDPALGAREHSGDASWYSTTPGACAHRTIPAGTAVTVTNVRNGKSATCTVEGWGPADTTRAIDLSEETFAAIEDPAVGVIPVRYTW